MVKQIEIDFALDYNLASMPLGLTFRDSKSQPVHRWYSYVEGFSSSWIESQLEKNPQRVYDPFGGSGTTQLEASKRGIESLYSEINPFMCFVAETKINSSIILMENMGETVSSINSFIDSISKDEFIRDSLEISTEEFDNVFPKRDFFEEHHLKVLLNAKNLIKTNNYNLEIQKLLLLALSSIAVDCSNMTKRADLRRRRPDEYKDRVVDVQKALIQKVYEMFNDLKTLPNIMKPTHKLSSDSKLYTEGYDNYFDMVITSPPYLNGTNYIRNTKIELAIMNFINAESDLSVLRRKTVCGGINDVSRDRKSDLQIFPYVEDVASELDEKAYDKRIPLMVRSYFSDMEKVLRNVYSLLQPGGTFVLDIGDSRFSGVHVPTDKILKIVAENLGFKIVSEEVLARRHSRDKTQLVQVGITLTK